MAQSERPKKVIEIKWTEIFMMLVIACLSVYFGTKTSRLSKKDEAHIAKQAVLETQRDSAAALAYKFHARVVVLEAKVTEANKNSLDAEKQVLAYKKKYNELKNLPAVHDTVKVVECEKLVERYDNWVSILKANVTVLAMRNDTLQLENNYLENAYVKAVTLSTDQKKELTKIRGKLRRHKILLWGTSGLAAGAVAVLLLK